MKKIFFFLTFCFFLGCKDQVSKDYHILKFDFKNKNLHQLFYGNFYYKVNGFSSTYNGVKYELSKPNNFLVLESELNEFNNHNKIILYDEKVNFKLYLHDLDTLKTNKITIEFNEYIKKTFSYFPVFSLEFLEKEKNRNSKIYKISDNELIPFYIDDYNYKPLDNLKNIRFYSNTLNNIKSLNDFNLFPQSSSDFFIIHNPLTNYYTLFPNISNFKNINNRISIPNLLIKKDSIFLNREIHLKNDTIIKNDWRGNCLNLRVSKGVQIILENDASIFFENSKIFFEGEHEEEIVFLAKGNNSLYFNNISEAKFDYTKFIGFTNLEKDSIILPSGVTFYNSNVEINHSIFLDNKKGDDYLNLYNSYFNILNTTFENIISDAIDSDFSSGNIKNSNFINIGNDAIDLSGSNAKIYSNLFKRIGDKSISVGENSKLKVECNNFVSSEIGLVVKDGSKVNSENNYFSLNKLDVAVFRKKNFFNQPTLQIDKKLKNLKYLIQNKSKIITPVIDSIIFTRKVEQMLYGNKYGKQSK